MKPSEILRTETEVIGTVLRRELHHNVPRQRRVGRSFWRILRFFDFLEQAAGSMSMQEDQGKPVRSDTRGVFENVLSTRFLEI